MNGGSGETDGQLESRDAFEKRKDRLKTWINTISKGDDGFTALHFAAFHGNMAMVKLLIKYGADVKA